MYEKSNFHEWIGACVSHVECANLSLSPNENSFRWAFKVDFKEAQVMSRAFLRKQQNN